MQARCKAEFRQKLIRVITDPLGFLFIACMSQFEVQLIQSGSAPLETHFLPDMNGPGFPVSLYERVKVRCYMDRAPKGWGSFPSSSPRPLSSMSLDFTPDPTLFMSQSSLILSLKTAQCNVCRNSFTFSTSPHLFSNSSFFRALLAMTYLPYSIHLRDSSLKSQSVSSPSPIQDL